MPTENTFTDYKITAFSEIAEQVRKWRNEGRSLVFTNGCFDLLHAGHIRYLQTAAAFADIFILGLNSDSSVRKLKGLRRPIMSQADRALLLSALAAIDCVVIFDEETPARLIATVLPDVLVKGGDYLAEDIVGYDTVTKNGGRVEVVSFVEGKSTTGIVNLIMEQV
ncbi:MAG: D-glycero-beta-D-manno-heptose 1-phosphate adenylyltransferase [bacterium]